MPLDVDNGIPGINVRFGKFDYNEISFLYHIDTCAAMSTCNTPLQQWIITKYKHLVAE